MAADATKQRAKLTTLNAALGDLEQELEPLFAQTLPETVLGLDTIEQAKLQVVLPYLVYDLVFIYLKTRGLDPKSHPVVAELDRIKQYFEKIKSAEQPDQRLPVDKDAANRFIKHAINQIKYNSSSSTPADEPSSSTGPKMHVTFDDDDKPVPVRVTEKMRERERYQAALREEGSDEEEDTDLAVIDDVPPEDDEDAEPEVQPSRSGKDAKGKGKVSPASQEDEATHSRAQAGSKRLRPAVDPFAGYGDETPAACSPPSSPKKAKKKKLLQEVTDSPIADSAASSGRNTPQLDADADKKRTEKKTKKFAKKSKERPLTSGS